MGGCFSNDDYYDTGSSSSRGYYRRPPPTTVLPFDNNNHHLHNSNTLYGGSTPYVVPTFSSRGISVSTRRTVLTPLPSSVLSPSSSISPSSSSSKNKHTSISRDEVKRHNTQNDCWIIVQNRVYNVTSFHHPGGTAILYALAGRDATHTFSSHHNFDPSKNHLQKYYIGDLIG